MTRAGPYAVTFTPAARRRLSSLPLPAATALYEHLTGPGCREPRRLGRGGLSEAASGAGAGQVSRWFSVIAAAMA